MICFLLNLPTSPSYTSLAGAGDEDVRERGVTTLHIWRLLRIKSTKYKYLTLYRSKDKFAIVVELHQSFERFVDHVWYP